GEQAFVPTPDRAVHRPAMVRTPVPHKLTGPACEPVPFSLGQQRVYTLPKARFLGCHPGEILAGANQTLKQESGFDQISAVVLASERNCRTGAAIDEMWKHAVIARRAFQEIQHCL